MAGPNTVFLGPTPEFPSLMTDKLTSMRENGTMTDFTITTKNDVTKLRCHKLVLAIHSPYIEAMFTTDMVEAKTNTVHYKDITIETMRIVLDYCYHEQVGFPDEQLMPLITASDYLQIERLKKRCVNEVKTFLTPENVLRYLTFAVEQNMKDIKSWCVEIIVKSFPEVSKQPDFLALTYAELQECVAEVVRSDANRDDVLSAVFKWIDDDTAERKEHLEELLQQVNPDLCSLSAILGVMETHEAVIAANVKVLTLLTKTVTKRTAEVQRLSEPAKTKPMEKTEKQLVIVGGQVNLAVNRVCWRLDKKLNKFSELSRIPFPELAIRHSVCEIPEGIALTGGVNSNLCVIFIASIKEWRRMPAMMRKRYNHASICISGKLYVLCGHVSDRESASVDCLTLETGQWESLQDAPVAAGWPLVAELNDKLFLLDAGTTNQLFMFDVKNRVWNQLASAPGEDTSRTDMIAVNGQLCVAGGWQRSNCICAWYNPSTDTWKTGRQNPIKVHSQGSLVQQDTTTLLLLGGSSPYYGTDDIEQLNTVDGSWSLKDLKMPVAKLWGHKAFYLDMPQD